MVQDLTYLISREVAILHSKGCRHVQVDEPLLMSIASTSTASETISMVKKIALCFDVSLNMSSKQIVVVLSIDHEIECVATRMCSHFTLEVTDLFFAVFDSVQLFLMNISSID